MSSDDELKKIYEQLYLNNSQTQFVRLEKGELKKYADKGDLNRIEKILKKSDMITPEFRDYVKGLYAYEGSKYKVAGIFNKFMKQTEGEKPTKKIVSRDNLPVGEDFKKFFVNLSSKQEEEVKSPAKEPVKKPEEPEEPVDEQEQETASLMTAEEVSLSDLRSVLTAESVKSIRSISDDNQRKKAWLNAYLEYNEPSNRQEIFDYFENKNFEDIADYIKLSLSRRQPQSIEDYETEFGIKTTTPEVKDTEAKLVAEGAKLEVEQVYNKTPFEELEDDLNVIFKGKNYPKEAVEDIKEYLKDKTKEEIGRFIEEGTKGPPMGLKDYQLIIGEVVEEPRPLLGPTSEMPTKEIEPVLTRFKVDPSIIPKFEVNTGVSTEEVAGDDKTTEETEVKTEVSERPLDRANSGFSKLPFVKRYHPDSLRIFFESDPSYPNWDQKLEANLKKADYDKKERIEMMNDIIEDYGSTIHIKRRKSDTIEELIELVQLQFCVLRNLAIGERHTMATVRLSDIQNIKNVASQLSTGVAGGMGGGGVSQPSSTLPNISPVVTDTDQILVQKESEQKFDELYDKYQRQEFSDVRQPEGLYKTIKDTRRVRPPEDNITLGLLNKNYKF